MSVNVDSGLYISVEQWLASLEHYLREVELWENEAPEASLLCSSTPFSADTLRFTQWLQWVLMPKLTALLEGKKTLPTGCNIQPYAEEVLKQESFAAGIAVSDRLVSMVGEIDCLLS